MPGWTEREVESQGLTGASDYQHCDVSDIQPQAGKKVQWKRCRHCGRCITAHEKTSDRHHLGASTGGFRVFCLVHLFCLADSLVLRLESN